MTKKKWGELVNEQNSPDTPEIKNEIEVIGGTCTTCGGGKFRLRIENGVLYRNCPKCLEIYKPDTGEVIKKGIWNEVK